MRRATLRYIVISLFLLIGMYTLMATPVRLEFLTGAKSTINVQSLTEEVIRKELDWRFLFDSEAKDSLTIGVVEVSIDEETFAPKLLYQVTLDFLWQNKQATRTVAFLVGPGEDWQTMYTEVLTQLVRANLGLFFVEEGEIALKHALDSGYWTVDALQLRRGRRVLVQGIDAKSLAIMEVADVFTYPENEVVTELRPVWASRPIVSGMSLAPLRFDFPIEIAGNFSLAHYGISLGASVPLWLGPFRLTSRITIDTRWNEPIYEALIHLGLKTQFSLGAFRLKAASVGKWWSNIQIVANVHFGLGLAWESSATPDFLYGAEATLQLFYQQNSHLYWGLTVGSHYRIRKSVGLQENIIRITLSPTLGWVW